MKNGKQLFGRALPLISLMFCMFVVLPASAQSNLQKINEALTILNNSISNLNNQINNNNSNNSYNYNSNSNYNSNNSYDYSDDYDSSNEIATSNRQRAYDNMANRAAKLYSDLTAKRYSGSSRTHSTDVSTYNKLRREMRKYRNQARREGIILQKSEYEDLSVN